MLCINQCCGTGKILDDSGFCSDDAHGLRLRASRSGSGSTMWSQSHNVHIPALRQIVWFTVQRR